MKPRITLKGTLVAAIVVVASLFPSLAHAQNGQEITASIEMRPARLASRASLTNMNGPARAVAGVSSLHYGALLEIEATAIVGQSG